MSQLAALGWRAEGAVTTVVGHARSDRDPEEVLESVHRAARRARLDALAGVHGGRLVVVLGGIDDPAAAAQAAAPRPVAAEDLLPERIINGDPAAREQLIDTVYRPLTEAGEAILDTVVTYLDSGRALEATARALFVHTNTVRYRLRRAAEVCGRAPTEARGAFTLQLALVLGRLADQDTLPGTSLANPAGPNGGDWR